MRFYHVIVDPGRDRYRIALSELYLVTSSGMLTASRTMPLSIKVLMHRSNSFSPRLKSCDVFQHCSALLSFLGLM